MISDLLKNLEQTHRLQGKTILIVGGTGFLGCELGLHFARLGCTIRAIDNSTPDNNPSIPYPAAYAYWDCQNPIPAVMARGADVIINAAGPNMMGAKWTSQRRLEIESSKTMITERCCEAANTHDIPIMLQMSWTGIYGDTRQTWTNEWFPLGKSMTAQWAATWERATARLRRTRTRLVIMRISPVLSSTGGPLMTLIEKYMSGLGASLKQDDLYFSWIHIDDFLAFVIHAIEDSSYEGVYNVCSDQPCTYLQAHHILMRFFPQQMVFGASTWAIKMSTGEKAALYLQSSRIYPKKLVQKGFQFKYRGIEKAFIDLLDYKVDNLIHFRYRYYLPKPRRDAYRVLSDVTNWPAAVPPHLKLKMIEYTSNPIREGTEVGYTLSYAGVKFGWREKVLNCDPGHTFQVMQLYGPFSFYEVTKTFSDVGDGTLYDIWHRYRISYGPLFNPMAYWNIYRTQMAVRDHEGKVLAEWFPYCRDLTVQEKQPPDSDTSSEEDLAS